MMDTQVITNAIIGGSLIGLAATLLMAFTGRVAGISGILGGVLSRSNQSSWQVAFILGLLSGGGFFSMTGADIPIRHEYPSWLLIIAGLLVGFGTRLGSGCTSGHGVCGIARLSVRSVVATVSFMLSGVLTVLLMRSFGVIS